MINSDSDEDKLFLFPKDSTKQIEFTLKFDLDSIKEWTLSQTLPIVIPLSSKEYLDWVFYDTETIKDVAMLLREDDVSD